VKLSLLLCILTLAMILGSCVTARQPYVEPTTGPTATLTFRNDTGNQASVIIYDDAYECKGRRHLDRIGAGSERTARVRAKKELAFTMGYTVPLGFSVIVCNVTVSYLPDTEQNYISSIGHDPNERKCYLVVARYVIDKTGKKKLLDYTDTKQRVATTGWDENSSFCKPNSIAAQPVDEFPLGRLGKKDVIALFSGNTANGKHVRQGFSFRAYFNPNGTIVQVKDDGSRRVGSWYVNDYGQHCYEWDDRSGCGEVIKNTDGTYSMVRDEEARRIYYFFRDGNPDNI
jgi:hypothetical protein